MSVKISIVIINYNRKTEILKLLQVLSRQTYKNTEIIIVDNNSQDGGAEAIQKKYSRVKVIKLTKNLGIGGLNIGLEQAKGDILLMLDNDAMVEKNLCQEIIEYFKLNPQIDAINFKVDNHRPGHQRTIPHQSPKKAFGFPATAISHGAGAIKRRVFAKIGGFNSYYFIYGSEFEYGARALNAGFKISFYPAIVVDHKEAFSQIRQSGKSSYFVARNWVYFLYEFIPLKDLVDFMPFSSKMLAANSSRDWRKMGYYILGALVGLLTCSLIIPQRTKLAGQVLSQVKGGILGTHGFVYPW